MMPSVLHRQIHKQFLRAIESGARELDEEAIRTINDLALGVLSFRIDVEDLQAMYRSRRDTLTRSKARRRPPSQAGLFA